MARADPPPTWIVIAAEPMTDVDTTASDVLEELDQALNDQGISLVFAELKDPVRRKIERYGLTRTINPQHFFPTVESAVAAFRRETGAEWASAGPDAAGGGAGDQGTAGEPGAGRPTAGPDADGPSSAGPHDVPASPPAG
jgi:hypothetical protein